MRLWIYLSVITTLLWGCEKKSKEYLPREQELRINLRIEPLSLDPRKSNDLNSISFIKMCFDGLTRIGLDGQPHPSIAEKIDISEERKIYTVHLKETHWSDGHPVTAYDFEKSWKTMLDPAFPCAFASDLFILKNARAAKMKKCPVDEVGVAALDPSTLQIELDHPDPYFLFMLSTHSFFPTPSHIVFDYPNWADEKNIHYVSNGPFRLKELRPSDYILLEKNDRYWDSASVKLERIYLFLIEDESTELSMFQNAELDWAGSPLSNLPLDALAALKNVHTYQMAGIYYYIFNTKDAFLKNKNLRRAFALAINRKEIIDNITQSHQSIATCFIPPLLFKENMQYFKDADWSEAKRYFHLALNELDLSVESFPPLTLSYNTMSSHHKIAQAIQEQWHKALGVKVRLENKEWKVYLDEQRHHKFQIARMGGIANNYDPISFLDRFRYLSSDENFSQWTHPLFTELLEKADHTLDPNLRTAYLLKAEKILMDEMPIIPIYFYTGSYLKKPYVKDVYLSELSDLDFKWAYVDVKK